MGFRIPLKNPQTIIRVGMLCLLVSLTPRWLVHPSSAFWQDALDGARGFFLPVAVAFLVWGFRLSGRRQTDGRS